MILPGFVGPSYVSSAYTADQEELYNMYVEPMEIENSETRYALYLIPGVVQLGSGGGGSGRAHFAQSGREFAVLGNKFVEIDQAGIKTEWGTVTNDSLPATISSSGDAGHQLFITSGTNGYLFDLDTNTFTAIAALAGIATMGGYLEGYFLALDTATSTLYASELLDGATWTTGTSFAQRTLAPDPWTTMVIGNRYIYLIGSQTGEAWVNVGASPFPFQPDTSAFFEFGCAATFSSEIVDGAPVWLGQTKDGAGMVIRLNGFTPEIISTFPVQFAINGYSVISDAIGDSYNDQGHTFYLLSFVDADITWAWDASNPNAAQAWAKRGTWIEEQSRFSLWRPVYHAYAFGQHRMLDIGTDFYYILTSESSTDVEDREIRWLRRAPATVDELKRVAFASFELDMDVGVGNVVDPGSNPQVMLRMSRDGGKTWGNERWRSAGAIGEYNTRVRWNRCGQARRRVFEVSGSDPVRWRLVNAYVNAEGEASA